MIKGFMPKQKFYVNYVNNGQTLKSNERDLKQEQEWHARMQLAGFQYDSTHDFYYSKDGALMSDSPMDIESLLTYPAYSECKNLGYEIKYGSPTPEGIKLGYTRAIYCSNFKEIVERHKNTEQGQSEIEEEQSQIAGFYDGVVEHSQSFRR